LSTPTSATIIVSSGALLLSTSSLASTAMPNLYISSTSGFVGISTMRPQALLHVSSGGFLVDGNGLIPLRVGVSSLVVLADGSIGLGVQNPAARFELRSSTGASNYVLLVSSQNSSEILSVSGSGNSSLVGALTASSATFTASGSNVFSLTVSSGIHILAGGIRWADGSTSTTAFGGSGGTGVQSAVSSFTAIFPVSFSETSYRICRATITATFTTTRVFVSYSGDLYNSSANQPGGLGFLVDGSYPEGQDSTTGATQCANTFVNGSAVNCSFGPYPLTLPSIGSHSVCLTSAVKGGTGTIPDDGGYNGTFKTAARFGVFELK
jgi:hypothetical protein